MNALKTTTAGTVLGGALLVAGGLSLAHAAPQAQTVAGDGQLNVTVSANGQQIGVLEDVSVANAAALSGSVCPTALVDTAALTALDNAGTKPANPCISGTGLSFTFGQNSPGQSENAAGAPGQNRSAEASTAAPTTTTSGAAGQQGS